MEKYTPNRLNDKQTPYILDNKKRFLQQKSKETSPLLVCFNLESTDAALEVPHPRPTRLPARRTAVVVFFFFFFSRIHADSAQFAPMRLDSCRIGFDSRRIGLIRPKSGRIGHIGHIGRRPILPIQAGKRPKQAETGRNRP